jgi:hypothetical protein
MTVQAFPVRFAETVNRFGAAPAERVGAPGQGGDPVLVTLGERTFVARAHGHRVTRRGRQTLVSVHGRLIWVVGNRVEPLGDPAATGEPATGEPA